MSQTTKRNWYVEKANVFTEKDYISPNVEDEEEETAGREEKKMFLRNTINVASQGGFIKERIKEELCELYPVAMIERLEEYYPIEPGFIEAADRIKKGINDRKKYIDAILRFTLEEKWKNMDAKRNENMTMWFIEQLIRLEAEKEKSGRRRWDTWELSRETRKVLNSFNALEEKILCCLHGIGGKKLTCKEIAALPEFNCDPDIIRAIVFLIDREFNKIPWGINEFDEMADRYA